MRFTGWQAGGGGEGIARSLPTLGLSQSTVRNAIKVRPKRPGVVFVFSTSFSCWRCLEGRCWGRSRGRVRGRQSVPGLPCMMYGSARTTLRIRNARSTRGRLRCNPFARQRRKGGAAVAAAERGGAAEARVGTVGGRGARAAAAGTATSWAYTCLCHIWTTYSKSQRRSLFLPIFLCFLPVVALPLAASPHSLCVHFTPWAWHFLCEL